MKETSSEVASIAARVLGAGNPLDNEQVLAAIGKARATEPTLAGALGPALKPYFDNMMTLAASALSQREDDSDESHADNALAIGKDAFRAGWDAANNADGLGDEWASAWNDYDPPEHLTGLSVPPMPEQNLGIEVSLVDVFSAWGEREARDTAMLIDLCLGAALEQLGGHEVTITADAMERLAASDRIERLPLEHNMWSVRLTPERRHDSQGTELHGEPEITPLVPDARSLLQGEDG